MKLLTLIFGILFLPKAYTLKCYECRAGMEGSCTNTETECPAQNYQCAAQRVVTYTGSTKMVDIGGKSCLLPEACLTASVNFGVAKTVFNSMCCDSDLCNSQPGPEPTVSKPNGKKCFTCNGQTCDAVLNCEGSEDYCISATVTVGGVGSTLKGCTTEQVCAGSQSSSVAGTIGGTFSCCQGNFCNSASGKSTGPLLLVAPLIYFIIFS